MAIVFRALTLFDLTARFLPPLHGAFERLGPVIGGKRERQAVAAVFNEIQSYDLSSDLLERLPQAKPDALLTLPVEGVLWSDWRSPRRVVRALTRSRRLDRIGDVPERRLFALGGGGASPRSRGARRKNAAAIGLG